MCAEVMEVSSSLKMAIEEKSLIESARHGDAEAFEHIVRHYMPKALAFARQMTGNAEDAQDLAQEAFLKAYRGLPNFKGDSSFGTWFYRILSNICMDSLRKTVFLKRIFFFSVQEEDDEGESLLEQAPDPKSGSRPDENIKQRELRAAIEKALKALPPRQKAVFLLKHNEEMKIAEIASVLKISEGAVKAHLVRAVTALRKQMKGLGYE